MAKQKEIVMISDITKFGDSLAKSIRANLRAVTPKLGGSGMVKLSNAQSRSGKTAISIVIGEGKKDPKSPSQPITGMIRAIESGARPHRISPRKGTRLAFMWPKAMPPFIRGKKLAGKASGGRLSFFYVDHPGMQGYHPIEKSLITTQLKATQELKANIRGNIVDLLNMTIKEINRK